MAIYLVQHGLSLPKDQDSEKGLSESGKEETLKIANVAKFYEISVKQIWHSGKNRAVPVNNQIISLSNTHYPIVRPLYLVTFANPNSKEMKFINWVLSSAGQKIVNQFFIGISQTQKSFPE